MRFRLLAERGEAAAVADRWVDTLEAVARDRPAATTAAATCLYLATKDRYRRWKISSR